MATVAIAVINAAPGDLLRVEAEFGVALTSLHVATAKQQACHRDTQPKSESTWISISALSIDKNASFFHLSFEHQNKPLQ